MLDYMQALRERFVGECDRERRQAIHNLRKEISQGIRKEYRRKLLRLVDLEAALQEEYALSGDTPLASHMQKVPNAERKKAGPPNCRRGSAAQRGCGAVGSGHTP